MQSKAFAALLAFVLAGCASAPEEAPPSAGVSPPPRSGDFVTAVGTPFFIVLKIPACVATAALAGPIVGASALLDNDGGRETMHSARQTVKQTCGPPYTLTP